MDVSDIAIRKFSECFSVDVNHINTDINLDSFIINQEIDILELRKLLIKNDLEEYVSLLMSYVYSLYFSSLALENSMKFEKNTENASNKKNHEKELTKLLIFLFSSNFGKLTSISFKKPRNSITISNQVLIETVVASAIDEFKENNYHVLKLTYQEAKAEMLQSDIWKNHVYIYENLGTYEQPDLIKQENTLSIERYADTHFKTIQIELDSLIQKYESMNIPTTRGAKTKNSDIAFLANKLLFLKRIDKYLSNKNIVEISQMPLTNQECRFIHDFLVCFNLVENKNTSSSKTLPQNFIKSIFKAFKPDWFELSILKETSLRIESLRDELFSIR